MNYSSRLIVNYDNIAAEYYNPIRHPTCANFAELSKAFLTPRIQERARSAKNILEVGVGRSTVAPILAAEHISLGKLILLDESRKMLEHSRIWEEQGARLIVADALNTRLQANHFQLIVSSLGDPYNGQRFWFEIERLLQQDGICLFTTPSYEWAERFRAGSDLKAAEFVLANGTTVLVRSEIPSVERQIEIINATGLRVVETKDFSVDELSQQISPKLLVSQPSDRLPIVRGFAVVKQQPRSRNF
jgi:ubiquinone/menaquinone biosynthesis C-methylase UbiE